MSLGKVKCPVENLLRGERRALARAVVLVGTVRAGRPETVVADMTDMFLTLLPPGDGEKLQDVKRSIMEPAHLILVNRADSEFQPAADWSSTEYRNALHLLHSASANWTVPVQTGAPSPTAAACQIVQKFPAQTSDG